MNADRPLLVLDTASPRSSLAVGTASEVLASRTMELHRSSELLLRCVGEALAEAGLSLKDLGGVAALQGPGSFTGLRIGLATVLGWHQALGLPATAVSTFDVLARAAGPSGKGADVVAAVDALRGDWHVRRFRGGEPLGDSVLASSSDLAAFAPSLVVGFGVSRLAAEPGWPAPGIELVEAPPLAPVALPVAAAGAWEPERLCRPVYSRPPAVSKPSRQAER